MVAWCLAEPFALGSLVQLILAKMMRRQKSNNTVALQLFFPFEVPIMIPFNTRTAPHASVSKSTSRHVQVLTSGDIAVIGARAEEHRVFIGFGININPSPYQMSTSPTN